MDPAAILPWLASLSPAARDAAIERHLGIADTSGTPVPGEHLVGYHASGVAPIVRMLLEVPVLASDTLIDLGSGLGKVVLLARLLAGANVRGIELQPVLVQRARAAARRCDAKVQLVQGDACDAPLDDGTVFFLYVPFTGPVLARVLARLQDVARRRAIVVCTLGVDVDRQAPWLRRRPLDAFWLSIYDSVVPGVAPRLALDRPPAKRNVQRNVQRNAAQAVAFERPCTHEPRSTL